MEITHSDLDKICSLIKGFRSECVDEKSENYHFLDTLIKSLTTHHEITELLHSKGYSIADLLEESQVVKSIFGSGLTNEINNTIKTDTYSIVTTILADLMVCAVAASFKLGFSKGEESAMRGMFLGEE